MSHDQDELPPTLRLRYRCIALPGGGAALRGAIAFMAGSHDGFASGDLLDWLEEHLVAPGRMERPRALHERGAAPLPVADLVDRRASARGLTRPARERVLITLGGLLSPLKDTRFLRAAIHDRRVRREPALGKLRWVPSPRETDPLSDIVLSLFAADILFDPVFFCEHLCICQACARVSVEPREAAVARICTRCAGGVSFSQPPHEDPGP